MLFCPLMLFHPYWSSLKWGGIIFTCITGQKGSFVNSVLTFLPIYSLPAFSFSPANTPSTLPAFQSFPHWSPDSITHLFVCALPFSFKIPQAIMAPRAPTRTTVAHGSATSMAGCSRPQTTPTPTRLTRSAFTSWKVKQGFLFRLNRSSSAR